jgi:hypothetical protein
MIRACSMTGQPIRTSLKVGEWGPHVAAYGLMVCSPT